MGMRWMGLSVARIREPQLAIISRVVRTLCNYRQSYEDPRNCEYGTVFNTTVRGNDQIR